MTLYYDSLFRVSVQSTFLRGADLCCQQRATALSRSQYACVRTLGRCSMPLRVEVGTGEYRSGVICSFWEDFIDGQIAVVDATRLVSNVGVARVSSSPCSLWT